MRETCWKILDECCAVFARQSAWSSANRCSRGRLDCARPTGAGLGIGTVKSQKQHRFNHIVRARLKCLRIWKRFTSTVASLTKRFTNIDCTKQRVARFPGDL